MPKKVEPLTVLRIKNAKPRQTPYTMFDGAGLHVLIQPTGTKTFRLKIKIGNHDKRITIGNFGEIDLAQARLTAQELRKKVASGVDPTVKKMPSSFTFVADRFISWKESVAKRAPATIKKYRECLENDLLPAFGSADIKDLHTAEVVEFLEKVYRRSPSLAQKNKELISMVIRFAIQRGLRPAYTQLDLSGVTPRPKAATKRMILPSQFPAKKIDRCRSPIMQCAIRLQFLCFLRANETMGSCWVDIDWDNTQMIIPDERMKMRRPHVVPLSKQALETLRELQGMTGGHEHLFPSLHRPGHMHRDSLSKIFRDLSLGLHPHACRTLFSTWARNAGYPPHVVEAQLSHVEENSIAAAYLHAPHLMYLAERTSMMQAWADVLMPSTTER